jgi:hypothetical protein
MNRAGAFATVFIAARCDSTSGPSNVQLDKCTHYRIFIGPFILFHLTMLKRFGIVDGMNKLSTQRRAQIVAALVEGELRPFHVPDDGRGSSHRIEAPE